MPGLIGFTFGTELTPISALSTLEQMGQLVTHVNTHKQGVLFYDDAMCATQVNNGLFESPAQPYYEDGKYVWIDGEILGDVGAIADTGEAPISTAAILCRQFCENERQRIANLRRINGIFSAVVYDSIKREIHLLTDRYGLRHLYWTTQAGFLAWGSEVKTFVALPQMQPRLREQAVKHFFSKGHLLDDETWLEGVELLPPGSILTWKVYERSASIHSYYLLSELEQTELSASEDEIVEELGQLLIKSVTKCFQRSGALPGIRLSGGLDSRALVAAAPSGPPSLQTLTFGVKDCPDIKIASEVVGVKGACHHVLEFTPQNWFNNRLDGVWWTDGQFNLIHMHALPFYHQSPGFFKINVSGILGGAVLGGAYIDEHNDSAITGILCRGRRFISMGTVSTRNFQETRLPFLDNDLFDFAMMIPARLRRGHYIYKKMLLSIFPEYYRSIPWQKTGVPIGWGPTISRAARFGLNFLQKWPRRCSSAKMCCVPVLPFANYSTWILQNPAAGVFEELLLRNHAALYQEYIPASQVRSDWERHCQLGDRTEMLGRYLTFEIWLQQLFLNSHRPDIVIL